MAEGPAFPGAVGDEAHTDDALLAESDHDAARLYRELAPSVLGYLRVQGASDPEDLLGEVFLHVVRDLRRFRGDEAARRRWVFTIAHHRLVDEGRRRRRRPETLVGELDHLDSVARPAVAGVVSDPELRRALIRLSEALNGQGGGERRRSSV